MDIREYFSVPPIGSQNWFSCIDPGERSLARKLVANRAPVSVEHGAVSLVLFQGTNFVAAGFSDPEAAEQFVADWNGNA